MSNKPCPVQDVCPKYESGDSKPPNNDVRRIVVCASSKDLTCELYVSIMSFFGEVIACDPVKIRRIKKELGISKEGVN